MIYDPTEYRIGRIGGDIPILGYYGSLRVEVIDRRVENDSLEFEERCNDKIPGDKTPSVMPTGSNSADMR